MAASLASSEARRARARPLRRDEEETERSCARAPSGDDEGGAAVAEPLRLDEADGQQRGEEGDEEDAEGEDDPVPHNVFYLEGVYVKVD